MTWSVGKYGFHLSRSSSMISNWEDLLSPILSTWREIKIMVNLKLNFRKANIGDLKSLLLIEEKCFRTDRLSRRSFQGFIKNTKDDLLIVELDKQLVGYGVVLYKKGSSLARLYSIAIDPNQKGNGIGKKLLIKLEELAVKKKSGLHAPGSGFKKYHC